MDGRAAESVRAERGTTLVVVLWALVALSALALAWAAHPLQVSAVLYVVQRIQTMGTLFLVLALWAYLQARQAQIERGEAEVVGLMADVLRRVDDDHAGLIRRLIATP